MPPSEAESISQSLCGTQLYMSPEQLAGKQYSEKVDMYAWIDTFELLCPMSTEAEKIKVSYK